MGNIFNSQSFQLYALICACLCAFSYWQCEGVASAAYKAKQNNTKVSGGTVYPEFRSKFGSIRWLSEQMPLKVYVSPGQSVDKIIDPDLAVCAFNVDNLDHWPDFAANLLQDPEQVARLPLAQGFYKEYYQAAIDGINQWKPLEKEGLFSFVITEDPKDADIYFFWVNHFVNKLGFGFLSNDIRGYTAKRSFWYREINAGAQADFKPVISLLRTTNRRGEAVPVEFIRAAAAHEFGHALGIEGHSTNPQDLMSLYYGRGVVSANDAATIRHLYHTAPDLVP